MQQQSWRNEPSLGELFGDLTRETKQLVRQEVQLAKIELKESAKQVGRGAAMIGVGALLGMGALLALLTTVIAVLATFMPVWAAALIVTAITGAGAYVLATKGMKIIQDGDLAPRETIETVREDVVWLKKRA